MKQLDKRQSAFKAEEITYLDRKSIQLDRMLLRFFELLRFDGHPAVRRRRQSIDIEALLLHLNERSGRFAGFQPHPEIAEAWLTNDLLDIINRGKPGREAIVGPRPYHLNAFKLANPKYVQDYGASTQVWAMLFHADRTLLTRLKEFFGRGVDPATDRYDLHTTLDLETLAVLGLVDQVKVDHATAAVSAPLQPLCVGQGRVLADDLRRLLAYEGVMPRHMLAGYVRTALGLHLALLMLRLFKLIPDWVERARLQTEQPVCEIEEGGGLDCGLCPYHLEMVVDMVEDPKGATATLAIASANGHLDGITAYVRAVLLLNRVKDYAAMRAARGLQSPTRTVHDLLAIIANPPPDIDGFFNARISDVITLDPDEDPDPIEQGILRMSNLTPLEQYVELICRIRLKNERQRLIQLIDSLTDKNRPGGFLRQTAGRRTPRWFVLGSRLLEMLVQLALIERDPSGSLQARPMLIDDFVEWLRTRYGFVIYAPAHRSVPPDEQVAWRRNEQALRERLHQIGFFTDLSDAYNSQTLRPRYEVSARD